MKTINLHLNTGLFKRLLTMGAIFTILFALIAPGFASAAPATTPYIIVFKDWVNPAVEAPGIAKAYGLQTGFIYQHALKGMSAEVPAGRLLALQHDPRVAYVVGDMLRTVDAQTVPTGIQRIFADENSTIQINGNDDYRVDVDVAVIDTGVDFQHPDLNVAGGVNCTVSIFRPRCDPGGDDDHYHGTHVAGTIGALDNDIGVVGVAPGARIWAVKVLNKQGSGWSSWIIAGIDWVAANSATIEVANMSLSGAGFSQAEYDAIQGAVNKGVAFAVAAGNDDDDANNYSPAGFDNVLSVSALADFDGLPGGLGSPTCRTDQDDTLADFSNWGPEVDIAAPGVCILSTYPLEQGEYGTISGTSMASPHVAGALALLASRNNPNNAADVYALYNTIKGTGNYNWTDDSGDGIKEPLLDVSNSTIFKPVLVPSSGGETNQPPVASFDFVPSNLTVDFTNTSSDSDGSIVSWSWDFGDGDSSAAQNPAHTYAAAGTYTVKLTVTDDDGATDAATQDVTVSITPVNTAPSVTISSPADGTSFDAGSSVTFSGSASDAEDGNLTSSLVWSSDLDDEIGRGGSFNAVLSTGTHTITASVIDSGGLNGSDSIIVFVNPLAGQTVTVASLVGSSTTMNKNFWRATVMATIDPALAGAVVSGIWSDGTTASCTTGDNGQCEVTVNVRTKTTSSIVYTIEGVTLAGYEYVPGVTSVIVDMP